LTVCWKATTSATEALELFFAKIYERCHFGGGGGVVKSSATVLLTVKEIDAA
jgi:hypothetical protein